MTAGLYRLLGIPDSCYLGRRVYKKHFYERVRMNAADKKAFSEDIVHIRWEYTLKPSTIAIAPYDDGVHEYVEVALLQVDVTSKTRVGRLADIIHKAIPYPVVVVFAYVGAENPHACIECALSVAPKRVSQSGADALVVEQVLTTSWLGLEDISPITRDFVHSINMANLPIDHFYALYVGLADRMRSLAWAERTGRFSVATTEEHRQRQQEQMDKYRQLEAELTRLKAAIKRETQFNRKVELNMMIKRMEDELRQLTAHAL